MSVLYTFPLDLFFQGFEANIEYCEIWNICVHKEALEDVRPTCSPGKRSTGTLYCFGLRPGAAVLYSERQETRTIKRETSQMLCFITVESFLRCGYISMYCI